MSSSLLTGALGDAPKNQVSHNGAASIGAYARIFERTACVTRARAIPAQDYKACMRRFAAAVNIITTADGDAWAGLTATAVCSLSAEPARVLCCINLNGVTLNVIRNTGVFCINTLSEDHRALSDRFAGMSDIAGEDRFALGNWAPLKTGAPALEDAAVALDCAVETVLECETHSIVIGTVVEARLVAEKKPLLWLDGGYAQAEALV